MPSRDELRGLADVAFDFGVAASVSADFAAAAGRVGTALGAMARGRAVGREQFEGPYLHIYDGNGTVQQGDGGRIAEAFRQVVQIIAKLEEAAREENQRRAAAREWVARKDAADAAEARKSGLDKGLDAVAHLFGGGRDDGVGDVPPSVNLDAKSPSFGAPRDAAPKGRERMQGIVGSGATRTSGMPENLRSFARTVQGSSDGLKQTVPTLDAALRSFGEACQWATLNADGCVDALRAWLDANHQEVEWAGAVADALERAGGEGAVRSAPTSAVTASLAAHHVAASRASVVVEPPSGFGSPPTTGYADDPVNTATGNFLETETDLSFGGASSLLELSRTYNSLDEAGGAFGPGWSSWTECRLALDADAARLTLPDGRMIRFGRLGDGWDRSDSDHLVLVRTQCGLEVRGAAQQVWRFSPSGRLMELWQGPASSLVFTHDGRGRVVRVQHAFGRWFELVHDDVAGASRVVAARTSDGRRVDYRYDELGRLVGASTAGAERTYRWDEAGILCAVVDPDGVVEVENTYDEQRRVTSQRSPHGRTTVYGYLPGNVTAVSDEDGTRGNTWVHDARGRLVGIVDTDGNRQSMAYDADDNVVLVTERNGATTVAQYDEWGRQTARVLPSGARLEWSYDEQGRVVEAVVVADDQRAVTSLAYEGDAPDPVSVTDPMGGVTSMVWDRGLLAQVTDPTGVTVRLGHDEFGELVSTTDALGNTARLERDAQGRVVAAVTPLGHRTTYRYDEVTGALVSQTDPTGATWRYEHTAAGRTTAVIDPLGHRTEVAYDEAGEQAATTDPLGRTITQQWDDLGNLASVELPDGSRWGFGHDGLSRLTQITDGTGGRWQMEYDVNGNLRRVVDATGVEQTVERNVLGLPTNAGDAESRVRASYDQLGRMVTDTAEDGSVTRTRYDLRGDVVEFTDEAGATTTIRRDAAGRIVSVTHPMGSTFHYEYDACGRHAATVDTDGSRYELEYDADGRVAGEVWPTGERVWSKFDAAGRVIERFEPGQGITRYEYDAIGRVVRSRDMFNGTRKFRYDGAGQLVEAINAVGGSTRFEYDEMGRLAVIVDPMGGRTVRTYDSLNRILTTTDPLGRTTYFGYDAAGRPTKRVDAAGSCLEWAYDRTGRLVDEFADGRLVGHTERDFAGRTVRVTGAGGVNELAWDERGNLVRRLRDGVGLGWSYDADGRRTRFTRPDGSVTSYEYDEAGRVCAVEHTGLGRSTVDRDGIGRIVAVNGPGMHATWTWADGSVVEHRVVQSGVESVTRLERDADGRLLAEVVDGRRTEYVYDPAGQLVETRGDGGSVVSFAYDANGRLVSESGPQGVTRFAHDVAGQLVSMRGPAGVTEFGYDAAGRRVREAGPEGERRFSWDPRGFLARVTRVAHGGDLVRAVSDELVVDALGELASVNGTGVLWDSASVVPSVAQVGSRSVVQFAGATGLAEGSSREWLAPQWRDRGTGGDPWGAPRAVPTGGGVRVGGQGSVQVAGLEWMQARVYDPETRGFLSTDPLDGVAGAGWAGNPYSFAGNDPVQLSDPWGLSPITDGQFQGYGGSSGGLLGHMWGGLKHAASAAGHWIVDHKNYISAGAMVAAGIAAGFIPVVGPALSGALISAGISTGMQQWKNGSVNWGRVGIDGVIGAFSGGIGGKVAGALAGRLGEAAGSLLGRVSIGAAGGGSGGGVDGALHYLTSPGPKSVGGFLRSTLTGAAGGAVLGGAMGAAAPKVAKAWGKVKSFFGGGAPAPAPLVAAKPANVSSTTANGCFVAGTEVLMGDGSCKPIEDVVVGDEVLAWNAVTGATSRSAWCRPSSTRMSKPGRWKPLMAW